MQTTTNHQVINDDHSPVVVNVNQEGYDNAGARAAQGDAVFALIM